MNKSTARQHTGHEPEIEITPEMARAGASVLCDMTTYFGADEEYWAREVYIAMSRAHRLP